jgi:hypothetical protein
LHRSEFISDGIQDFLFIARIFPDRFRNFLDARARGFIPEKLSTAFFAQMDFDVSERDEPIAFRIAFLALRHFNRFPS